MKDNMQVSVPGDATSNSAGIIDQKAAPDCPAVESAMKSIASLLNREIDCDCRFLFIQILFFAAVFSACFFLFYEQLLMYPVTGTYEGADMRGHLWFILQYAAGGMDLPHPGMHKICYYFARITGLRVEYALVMLLSIFATASAFIIYLILGKFLKRFYSSSFLLFATALMLVASAVSAPFFNRNVYLFQGSPNVWHNPTLIAVRPFAFIALMLIVPFFVDTVRQKKTGLYFLISGVLLLSTWIKPNFVLSFLPALAIWILIRYPKRLDLYWKSLLLVLPSLGYLAWQYMHTFASEPGRGVMFNFLGVWRLHSPNPWVSLGLAVAFPALLALFRFRHVMRDPYFLLCALNLVVATLQMMCLAEKGRYYSNANFAWGYLAALSLIFVVAMVKYLEWIRAPRTTILEVGKITVVTVALSLHITSGIYYTGKIWGGWNYH